MVKSASETRVHFQTLCRILFAIVAKWSINAHLGKWWEENNDDFLLANVSTHVRKEGKQKSCWKEGMLRYHGIQRTFDFYAAVSNACKYDSCGKKIYFLSFFSPLLFSSKRKVSVFDLYSISRIKRTEYIPMLRAYARKQSKKSRNCQSGHLLNFLSKTKEILGKRAFVLLSPRRQGGLLWLLLLSYS